jgi:hypothetical protein
MWLAERGERRCLRVAPVPQDAVHCGTMQWALRQATLSLSLEPPVIDESLEIMWLWPKSREPENSQPAPAPLHYATYRVASPWQAVPAAKGEKVGKGGVVQPLPSEHVGKTTLNPHRNTFLIEQSRWGTAPLPRR